MGSRPESSLDGGGTELVEAAPEIVCCEQADEAIRAVRQATKNGTPFAAAFIDVHLPPGGDGLAAARAIRGIDPALNIVIVTGKASPDPPRLARAVGPADKLLFLHKPFHPHEISHLTAACIARRELEAALRSDQARLELLVDRRTRELRITNERLKQDISRRRRVEAALKRSEERYALAAQGANDGLWDWDLVRGEVFYSARWCDILGLSDQTCHSIPATWFDLVHAEDRDALDREVQAHLAGTTRHFEHEHRLLHEDGSYRWVLSRGLASRLPDGTPTRFSGSLTDITKRKQAEAQLVYEARHDSLTGLSNRQRFLFRLDRALSNGRRYEGHGFAVIFLDLDRFKLVNDSLGHQAGDRLLRDVADRLRSCLRTTDTLARYGTEHTMARLGGDEFTILLEHLQAQGDALRVAERVRESLAAPFELDGHEVFTSASMGITFGPAGYQNPTQLLRDADIAMYRAKTAGGGGYAIFDEEMHQRVLDALVTETELRHAVARSEFRLVYQPIVALPERRIVSLEALLRWTSPSRGPIPPGKFIPIAEESGLIHPIGSWVLEKVSSQVAHWKERLPACPPIAINISSRQLQHRDFVQGVEATLNGARQHVKFEITESVFLDSNEITETNLDAMRAMGIELHLDDFGTGFSSLSYLHRLPFQVLKLDRSFSATMKRSQTQRALVRSIISLAHALDMRVVAEGIDRTEDIDLLESFGCDLAQGFVLSRPIEADAVERMLARSPCLLPKGGARAPRPP